MRLTSRCARNKAEGGCNKERRCGHEVGHPGCKCEGEPGVAGQARGGAGWRVRALRGLPAVQWRRRTWTVGVGSGQGTLGCVCG